METSTRFRGTADDKPLGELVQDLSRQTSTLIRQEMRLAQAELAEKGRHAGKGAGMFGAALLLIAGTLALTGKKKLAEAGPPKPEQALDSVQRDIETVKERTAS
jgi:hypothetical protein